MRQNAVHLRQCKLLYLGKLTDTWDAGELANYSLFATRAEGIEFDFKRVPVSHHFCIRIQCSQYHLQVLAELANQSLAYRVSLDGDFGK